jgi:hypothetical protein
MNPPNWILRPALWFASASMVTTILHESTHACVAYALGIRATLFNYAVDLDLRSARATIPERALIGVAGPLFCMTLGTVAWFGFRRARGSAAELPLLYLSLFGIGTFFGNLMSTSFVGDFAAAALMLNLPMAVRYTVSLIGGLLLAAVHFRAGREIARWVPARIDKMPGALGITVLPAVIGTAVVILVNLPMSPSSMAARAAEASFWLFAVIGAVTVRRPSDQDGHVLRLRWADGVVMLLAVLAVRLMVRGISFVP